MKGIFKTGTVAILLVALFSCTDNTTDDVTSYPLVKDTLFTAIPKTKFTGTYDTLGYIFLVNTISKNQYESLKPSFPKNDSLSNSICDDKKGGCMEALEKYYISKVSGRAKRLDKELTLFLTGGKTVVLKNNNNDDDNYEVYQFISLDQNGYFIVAVYYMESYGYLLINSTNGKTISTIGYPVFSPDHKRYVAGNYDMMAAFTFNGIDLMTATGDGVFNSDKIDFGTWGPDEVKWKDDSTLYVRQKSQAGENATMENNFAALRIRKKTRT